MTTASVRFPDVAVRIYDEDTVGATLYTVSTALWQAGYDDTDVYNFYSDVAACRDHDDVLRLVRATVRTI